MTLPFSDEDVDLVAEAVGALRNGVAGDGRGWYRSDADRASCYEHARAALDALARAGRLLPEGAETRIQWAVRRQHEDGRWTHPATKPSREDAEWAIKSPPIYWKERSAELLCREVTTAVGPWLPAADVAVEAPETQDRIEEEGARWRDLTP